MNTAPDLAMPTPITATDPANAASTPRTKLLSHGFAIDHPDPEIGDQLMADAFKPAPTYDDKRSALAQAKARVGGHRRDHHRLDRRPAR